MLKHITSIALFTLFLTACTQGGGNTEAAAATTADTAAQAANPPLVGNDRDEHGCIGSAGYTWSQLKNECVRTFEAGTRLDAVGEGVDKTTSAFVIFNADQSKAELFMPGSAGSKIMERQGDAWVSGTLKLSQSNGYTLADGDKALYQGK